MGNKTGIYVHIPFCTAKCPYCDFYSLPASDKMHRQYIKTVCDSINREQNVQADTLYFGGGTPSLLEPALLEQVIKTAQEQFSLSGETTIEANPCTVTPQKLVAWKKAGINRLSFGMQSANPKEQQTLGRRHSTKQVEQAVLWAKEAGFENLSVDLMLGVPYQTIESLLGSIAFLSRLGIQHVSAYLLKIEEGTPFAASGIEKDLPDEDLTCELYLTACRELEKLGFMQYEISNFAKPGMESKHNLKYWNSEDYLGYGPSAHSFYQGKRFYYPRDLDAYLKSGGTNRLEEACSKQAWEDFLMLRFRLRKGVGQEELLRCCPEEARRIWQGCRRYVTAGLMEEADGRIAMTPKGFLVSNAILSQLL